MSKGHTSMYYMYAYFFSPSNKKHRKTTR